MLQDFTEMVRGTSSDGEQEIEFAGDGVAVLNEWKACDGFRNLRKWLVTGRFDADQGRDRKAHRLPVDDDSGSRDHPLFGESTDALMHRGGRDAGAFRYLAVGGSPIFRQNCDYSSV